MVSSRKGYTFSFVLIVLIIVVASGIFYLTHNSTLNTFSLSPKDTVFKQSEDSQLQYGDVLSGAAEKSRNQTHLACIYNNTCVNTTYSNLTTTITNTTCYGYCVIAPGPGETPPMCITNGTVCGNVTTTTYSTCTWQFGPEIRLTNDTALSHTPTILFDSSGNAHVFWLENYQKIYHIKLSPTGSTIKAKHLIYTIPSFPTSDLRIKAIIDENDLIHLVTSSNYNTGVIGTGSRRYLTLNTKGIVLTSYPVNIPSTPTSRGLIDIFFDYQDKFYVGVLQLPQSSNQPHLPLISNIGIKGKAISLALLSTPNTLVNNAWDNFVSLRVSPDQNYIDILYHARIGTIPHLQTARFDLQGNLLRSPTAITSNVPGSYNDPIFLRDSFENLHVLYCNGDYFPNLFKGIYYSKLDSSGSIITSLLPIPLINPTDNCYDGDQDGVIDSHDVIHLVYSDFRNSGSFEIYYKKLDNNGVVLSDASISDPARRGPGGQGVAPSMAINSNAESVAIAWQDNVPNSSPPNDEIYARFYSCI